VTWSDLRVGDVLTYEGFDFVVDLLLHIEGDHLTWLRLTTGATIGGEGLGGSMSDKLSQDLTVLRGALVIHGELS